MVDVASSFLAVNAMSVTDFVQSALRLVGSLSSGEPAEASEIQDGGMILNQMLDAWSTQRLTIFTTPRVTTDSNGQTLTLNANQQAYKVGLSTGNEDFLIARPPRIERASVIYSASQSTPSEVALDMLDPVGWQAIMVKTVPSLIPTACFDDLGYPDRTLYFWPVPTQANPIALYPWVALTQFTDFTTKMAFPPGYPEAIRYNLAMRLFAEFPGNPAKFPIVQKLASESLDRIKSFNTPMREMQVDDALLGGRPRGNIYTGLTSRSRNV